jgi:hypothetical protein
MKLSESCKYSHNLDVNTWTARALLSTLDNIATPCSVKAYGRALREQPQLEKGIKDLNKYLLKIKIFVKY